jgi:hypothetical protein
MITTPHTKIKSPRRPRSNPPPEWTHLARTLKKMTEEGLVTRVRCAKSFPVKVFYSLNPEVLDFLTRIESIVAWPGEHPELVAQAQAYSRRHGDISTLTGIAELDIVDITDEDADGEPVGFQKSARACELR